MAQTAEITDSPLWDTVVVLHAGVNGNVIQAFTKPQNSNDEAGNQKSKTQTSLETSTKLNEPESFDVHIIQCVYLYGTAEVDIQNIENSSYIEFYTAGTQTRAFECPKFLITPGTGFPFTGTNAVAGTANTLAQPGYPSPGAVFRLDKPIPIGINEGFQLQHKFNGLTVPGANTSMRWILRGPHYLVDVTATDPQTGKEYSTRRSSGALA